MIRRVLMVTTPTSARKMSSGNRSVARADDDQYGDTHGPPEETASFSSAQGVIPRPSGRSAYAVRRRRSEGREAKTSLTKRGSTAVPRRNRWNGLGIFIPAARGRRYPDSRWTLPAFRASSRILVGGTGKNVAHGFRSVKRKLR